MNDNARAAALAAPLPEEGIERTLGSKTQKGYDTTGYGYQWLVNRFNAVCGDTWGYSWEVIREDKGVFRSGQPYWDITVSVAIWVEPSERVRSMPGGHISGSYADALKGAITNGFKKAAAMWGVGRQAYEGTIDDDNAPADEGPEDMRPLEASLTAPREHWCDEHNTAFFMRGKMRNYAHPMGEGEPWCNERTDEPAVRGATSPSTPPIAAETASGPTPTPEATPHAVNSATLPKEDMATPAGRYAYLLALAHKAGWDGDGLTAWLSEGIEGKRLRVPEGKRWTDLSDVDQITIIRELKETTEPQGVML